MLIHGHTRAGAVNAMRRQQDGTLDGGLFDGIGLVKALDHLRAATTGRRVLLVGTGGAGMAIAACLTERSLATLPLFDAVPATPLQRACDARGIVCHPGFEMLAQQVPDYLRFFGLPEIAAAVQDDLEPVRRCLRALA